MTYYVFDLLYCDGYDLRDVPLLERKDFLRRLLRPAPEVRFSDHRWKMAKSFSIWPGSRTWKASLASGPTAFTSARAARVG